MHPATDQRLPLPVGLQPFSLLLDNGQLSIPAIHSNAVQVQLLDDLVVLANESPLSIVLLSAVDLVLLHVDVRPIGLYTA